jgi:hypothetical protein
MGMHSTDFAGYPANLGSRIPDIREDFPLNIQISGKIGNKQKH